MRTAPLRAATIAAAASLLLAACDRAAAPLAPARDAGVTAGAGEAALGWLRDWIGHPRDGGADAPAVLAGAGDIARCYPDADPSAYRRPDASSPAAQTARLLDRMPRATVMAVGDNAYEFGSPFDYLACYQPTWGRHRWRTRPAAGNHEYLTPGAAGYFLYFGARAAPPLGYYSYELGEWHVIVLNSAPQVYACWPPEGEEALPDFPSPPPVPAEPGVAAGRACAGDVAQQTWLAADLAAHAGARCTVAYFHHPRFSSGPHGDHFQMTRIWDLLYSGGVDLVVSGHDHLYERFAPQTPDGARDDAHGIRELVVGTGGAELYAAGDRSDNSEVVVEGTHGVAALALDSGGYAWAFVAVDGSIRDAGSDECHDPPVQPGSTPLD